MPRRKPTAISPRKLPKQERSAALVADILEAAIRVLRREGAQRFTTIRVAEEAGVSVGSLYQYFPNKQAILFRLQMDEWAQTGAMIDDILADHARTPIQRLHDTVRAFFHSECDEAPLRLALDAAMPSWKDEHGARDQRVVTAFMAEIAPQATPKQRAYAADVLFMTITATGKQLSEREPSPSEVDKWARSIADMLGLYLAKL